MVSVLIDGDRRRRVVFEMRRERIGAPRSRDPGSGDRMRRDGPPRMEGRSTWSGRERSSHSRFPPVPRVGLVTFRLSCFPPVVPSFFLFLLSYPRLRHICVVLLSRMRRSRAAMPTPHFPVSRIFPASPSPCRPAPRGARFARLRTLRRRALRRASRMHWRRGVADTISR